MRWLSLSVSTAGLLLLLLLLHRVEVVIAQVHEQLILSKSRLQRPPRQRVLRVLRVLRE